MSRDWETIFFNWSKPSSDTEKVKSENSERMVREAITESSIFNDKNVFVFSQGSYRNNTNVKQDSDVDICVLCHNIVMQDFSLSPSRDNIYTRLKPALYQYYHFKNDVETALVYKFGRKNFTRGEKAFDVHANTYRVDADVVPAIEYKLYLPNGQDLVGVCILSDSGIPIYNWPNQHYANGVAKNYRTNNKFKFVTRIIKRLRNEMAVNKITAADPIASYLIECLIYNVPDYFFETDSYKTIVENAISHLWDKTKDNATCSNFREVNDIKFLFHSTQKWTMEQVNIFLLNAWQYIKNNEV